MLESLNCNACGAPLEVNSTAKYVKCNHCQTQLTVHRSATATFTEAIERLSEKTEAISEQLEKLTRQQELANLDRDWEVQQKSFLISDQKGRSHLPTEGTAIFGGVFVVLFGIVWTGIAFSMASGAGGSFGMMFPVFGMVFIFFGVVQSVIAYQKAGDFRAARNRYQRNRKKVLLESQEKREK